MLSIRLPMPFLGMDKTEGADIHVWNLSANAYLTLSICTAKSYELNAGGSSLGRYPRNNILNSSLFIADDIIVHSVGLKRDLLHFVISTNEKSGWYARQGINYANGIPR